jgi:hypothetical protein
MELKKSLFPSPSDLRPETGFRLTLVQLIALGLALGGVGFSVGAVYPRLVVAEGAIAKIQEHEQATALVLERVTVIVERIDRLSGSR